jgi:tRNA (guanine37-N1)-methyltransferase
MLEIDVFTLVPSWFSWLVEERHIANALAGGLRLTLHNIRDHSPLRGGMVDDEPYGGGAGMLIRVDVAVAALEGAFRAPLATLRQQRRILLLDPGGRRFDDAYARDIASAERIVLLCGRYEGFDHRVHEHVATERLSVGPYILSGGEIAAMSVIDAATRHLEGALGAAASSREESFAPAFAGGLEHPHYTRPATYRGWSVPAVLRGGDHAAVAAWRRAQATARTQAASDPDPLR